MARRRIGHEQGIAAIRAVRSGSTSRNDTATAVRFLLEELTALAPGNAVEVRVPPFGAVQCIPGPKHTRGTPPSVIETDVESWLQIALGDVSWEEAVASGRISASGERADLSRILPVLRNY